MTEQTRQPTQRQRKAARALINNLQVDKPKTMGEILENSGYSEKTALTPKTVTELPGFKQALRELGLTEELITSSLVQDIKAKPEKRIQELKLGAEILGMVKREDEVPKGINNTYNFLFSEETQKQIREIDNVIKARLINNEPIQTN